MRRDPGRLSWNTLLPFSPKGLTIWVLLCFTVASVLVLPPAGHSATKDFYVAPNGRPDGDGSKERPWDLATALAQPAAVKPGDTIWLRGGTYNGPGARNGPNGFTSYLQGTSSSPITVRAYGGPWPVGERVRIDSGTSGQPSITVFGPGGIQGSNVWVIFRDLELFSSQTQRTTNNPGPYPPDTPYFEQGISLRSGYVKVINCIIHDVRDGIGQWWESTGSETYGNIEYFNGWRGPDHGWGTGFAYARSRSTDPVPSKRIADNIGFQTFDSNAQIYVEGHPVATLQDILFEGNVMFNAGEFTRPYGGYTGSSGSANFLAGSSQGTVVLRLVFRNNFSYMSPMLDGLGNGGTNDIGLYSNTDGLIVTNNYLVGASAPNPGALILHSHPNTTMTGNTFIGGISGFTSAEFPSNTYIASRPASDKNIFVRRNEYEPGRAHIIIYNWDRSATVLVNPNVSGTVLNVGDTYQVRDVQNYYGTPTVGTTAYSGGLITIPMSTSAPVAAPSGFPHAVLPYPTTTQPQFGMFVLQRITPAAAETPPPPPTPDPTPAPAPTPDPTPTPAPAPAPTPSPAPQPAPTPAPTSTPSSPPPSTSTPGSTPSNPPASSSGTGAAASGGGAAASGGGAAASGGGGAAASGGGGAAASGEGGAAASGIGAQSGSSALSPAATGFGTQSESIAPTPAASNGGTPAGGPPPPQVRSLLLDRPELLKNSSFDAQSNGIPQGWQGRNLNPSDRVDLGRSALYNGAASFRLTSGVRIIKQLTQTIPTSGPAGTSFIFGAASKASGTSPAGGAYQVEVQIVFKDGTSHSFPLLFTKGTHGWEQRAMSFRSPKDFTKLIVSITYANQTGMAWFSGFYLWIGSGGH